MLVAGGLLVVLVAFAALLLAPRSERRDGRLVIPGGPPGLALGIDEANPHLLAPGPQAAAFAPWRDRLAALNARYARVRIDWARVQPDAGRPPNWSLPADGCLRGLPPCAPFGGLRDELRAIGEAGMTPVITFLGTPDWADGDRCGKGRTAVPRRTAYVALLHSLAALGRELQIELPYWAPWNEPNNADFLGQCADPVRGSDYAEMAAAARVVLDTEPGGQRLVLGDAAGYAETGERGTAAGGLAAQLPDDLVCSPGAVWGQHAYIKVRDALAADAQPDKGAQILDDVADALSPARRDCPAPPIWITETGTDSSTGAAGCRAMGDALRTWARDPRVDAAFQYTFRDDTAFRVGLADESLTALRPAYAAWLAAAAGSEDPAHPC